MQSTRAKVGMVFAMAALTIVLAGHSATYVDALGSVRSTQTVTAGRLTVSRTSGLEPTGALIQVSGSGYDTARGIYVALCVIPTPGSAPSPCGGGIPMEGSTGSSQWISSNPPSYGVGLAVPYGPGGTFNVTLTINSTISPTIDCRNTRCAITTRRDHMASGDRSQDEIIPVTFGSAASTPSTVPTPPVTAAPAPAPNTNTGAGSGHAAGNAPTNTGVAPSATQAPNGVGAPASTQDPVAGLEETIPSDSTTSTPPSSTTLAESDESDPVALRATERRDTKPTATSVGSKKSGAAGPWSLGIALAVLGMAGGAILLFRRQRNIAPAHANGDSPATAASDDDDNSSGGSK